MGTTLDHIREYWRIGCHYKGDTPTLAATVEDDWEWWQGCRNFHGWDTSIRAKCAWEEE